MSVRTKVGIIITMIAVAIVVIGMGVGFIFVQTNLENTVYSDMTAVADISDKLVTTEINLLKANTAIIAKNLKEIPEEKWGGILHSSTETYGDFIALTVFDRDGIVDSYGVSAAPADFADSEYVKQAFTGESVISTTYYNTDGKLVFYICVPLGSDGRQVLCSTVSGLLFTSLLDKFTIWKTGNIFIVDGEGTVLSNIRENWVTERYNYIKIAERDNIYAPAADVVRRMTKGESGTGKFAIDGVDRICIYQPVSGSKVGWSLGVVAPLNESPMQSVRGGLLAVGIVCFILSVASAFVASAYIEKPYNTIRNLAESLEAEKEKAIAGAEAKSDFLANMSHEMRTPLNAIIGLAELTLDSSEVFGTAQENLEKVYNSGVTLLGLINDILDISKIDSGKFELIPAEYDIPSFINDTVTLNIVRIGSKPVKFKLDADENLPSVLVGDELRIKQIMNNLLSNAFKYTKEGTVVWKIYCEPHTESDSVWLVSSITDSGIGIKSEDIKKLFSSYNQVDTRSNRAIEGTGLGLSITKSMTALMDGEIDVQSVYGLGSTFTVRLKQRMAGNAVIGAAVVKNLECFNYSMNKRDRSSKLVRVSIPYAKVLVVDDVPTNLDVARGMMKPYGMQIDCVTSGAAAVELVRGEKVIYDAIFMDHMMPGMDGIEAARIIREEIGTEYAKNVTIIALTANALVGNEEMFLKNGFQAFLSKPIDIMRMDVVINQWVRNKGFEKKLAESGLHHSTYKPEYEYTESESRDGKINLRSNTKGFSVEKGLALFGDDEEIYLDVLKSYAVNTPELLEKLGEFKDTDLPNYAIVIHGIKSSSYSIGAESVGTQAEKLEVAAKAGNADFITARNNGFVEATKALLLNINDILREIKEETPKQVRREPDKEVLAALLEACENFDIDEADKAVRELEVYSYETQGDLVEWLRIQVSATRFKKVAERLQAEI